MHHKDTLEELTKRGDRDQYFFFRGKLIRTQELIEEVLISKLALSEIQESQQQLLQESQQQLLQESHVDKNIPLEKRMQILRAKQRDLFAKQQFLAKQQQDSMITIVDTDWIDRRQHLSERFKERTKVLKESMGIKLEQVSMYGPSLTYIEGLTTKENFDKNILMFLDTEKLNKLYGSTDYFGGFGFLTSTMARILIYILTSLLSLLLKIKNIDVHEQWTSRITINIRKLILGLRLYYAKNTKGRCLRITSLLVGEDIRTSKDKEDAKKTWTNLETFGKKGIYKLDSYHNYYYNISNEKQEPPSYISMKPECMTKFPRTITDSASRTRCTWIAKARENFNSYVDKHCDPVKEGGLLAGGKTKKRRLRVNKTRSNKKKNNKLRGTRKYKGGSDFLFILGIFGFAVILIVGGFFLLPTPAFILGKALIVIGLIIIVFMLLALGGGGGL